MLRVSIINDALERFIAALFLAAFLVTVVGSWAMPSFPLTEKAAVDMSRGTELVEDGLAIDRSFVIETHYYNLSALERLKQWHSDPIFQNSPESYFWERRIPNGHTAWEIIWWFSYRGLGGYNVIVVLDACTGAVTSASKGSELEGVAN